MKIIQYASNQEAQSLLDAIYLESLSSENKNKIENAKETSKSFNFKNIASQHNDFCLWMLNE